jgi:hypothetical protein
MSVFLSPAFVRLRAYWVTTSDHDSSFTKDFRHELPTLTLDLLLLQA